MERPGFQIMPMPPRDPLPFLKPLLEQLRARYGPYIISPPTGRSAPVAIVLPPEIRYCSECEQFKPMVAMRCGHICAACAGKPTQRQRPLPG